MRQAGASLPSHTDVHRRRCRHTRASERGDGRWRDLLAEHDQAVRKELLPFGGREIKTIGDGFLAAFDRPPSRALLYAKAVITRAKLASTSAWACIPASVS